ncbi:MAG: Acetyltransferase [Rickettsiaceae bacterium]|jgi:RimJ/RimL family protein N-acetyltransferase|nr:Acetyltransferase [Rickettsiaceae bacterium]
MQIEFEPATFKHVETIFSWLAEPHMIEFWYNSQEHKDDILNFINGRQQHYFYGTTKYWIGLIDNIPYSFILSDLLLPDQDLSPLHREYLSKSGNTISLDFGIGNKEFLGKKLAAPTLERFMEFYHSQIDPSADTFFIDPDLSNPRAKHVYEKAGFKLVGNFDMLNGTFKGSETYLLVKRV